MYMNSKDKKILKEASLVVADEIVSKIPALNIAWGLCKSLHGAGMKVRQDRALEWVEMIRSNPAIFTKQILSNENFQEGFILLFENYVRERNEEKRKIYKKIFLGFAKTKNYTIYPIEAYQNVVSQLTTGEIVNLKEIYNKILHDKSLFTKVSQSEYITKLQKLINLQILSTQATDFLQSQLSKLFSHLSSQKFEDDLAGLQGRHMLGANPNIRVNFSEFGKGFIRFLLD